MCAYSIASERARARNERLKHIVNNNNTRRRKRQRHNRKERRRIRTGNHNHTIISITVVRTNERRTYLLLCLFRKRKIVIVCYDHRTNSTPSFRLHYERNFSLPFFHFKRFSRCCATPLHTLSLSLSFVDGVVVVRCRCRCHRCVRFNELNRTHSIPRCTQFSV